VRRRALPALFFALACNRGFQLQYRVTDLRILAVRAEIVGSADPITGVTTADPYAGQTVQLEALVVNPLGRTGLTVTWYACAPTTDGSLPPCLDPTVLSDPAALSAPGSGAFIIGSGETPTAIPLSSPPLPQPVLGAFAAALQQARNQALLQPTYQCRIYVEIPVVVIAEAEGHREVALKLVRLVQDPADATPPYDGYVVNQNPLVDDAYRAPVDADACTGGTSIDPPAAYPSGRTTLCARASAASPPQTYYLCADDGTRTPYAENYGWQWYVSDGEFPDVGGLGNAEGTSLDFIRPAGEFTMWLILRDGRGGVSWKTIAVAPAQ
jgi:hypothetical protein